MGTQKLYYEDKYLSSCEARVIKIDNNKIELDKTIAFPEGGGQLGDTGTIMVNNELIKFYDTQKSMGRTIYLDDFPIINVETIIYHFIDESDVDKIQIGDIVNLEININRRMELMISHSALHIALMFLEKRRPEISKRIKGCRIDTGTARLDFSVIERFTQDEMDYVNQKIKEITIKDLPIKIYSHKEEQEAIYWECNDFICPCGGTHVDSTNMICECTLRRKNIGKNSERLILDLKHNNLFLNKFHK